jgi:hypothetical protein
LITGQSIGYITIENLGKSPVMLVSHARRSPSVRSSRVKLAGEASRTFDYRGTWAIEVRQGDCSQLVVTDFSAWGGTGQNNTLNMI